MEKKKKKFYKKWWFWLLVVILLSTMFSDTEESEEAAKETKNEQAEASDSKKDEKAKAKEDAKKAEPNKELTIEEQVEKTINDKVDKETNNDMKRVESIKITDDSDSKEGLKVANIVLNGDDNLTVNLTKTSLESKSADLFEILFSEYDQFSKIVLTWNLPLVDVKGNTTNDMVLKIGLTKDNGINWDNFLYDNFDHVADLYFLHNALKK